MRSAQQATLIPQQSGAQPISYNGGDALGLPVRPAWQAIGFQHQSEAQPISYKGVVR